MSLKQKYHITRSEQRAFGVLLIVVLLIIAGRWWFSGRGNAENDKISEDDRKELAAFEESLRADSLRRAARRNLPAAAELFPFNPNEADSATLLRLGLKPWQVRNLLKYRRKGGRWRSADDFRRLYGYKPMDMINFAVASSVIKHTIHGDGNITDDVDSIRNLMNMNYDIKR